MTFDKRRNNYTFYSYIIQSGPESLGFRQISASFYMGKVMQGLRPPECHWLLGWGIVDYGLGVVGVLQAPPLEMQQISPVFSWWGTGRAGDVLCIGRLVRTRVSSLPPPRAPRYRIGISKGTWKTRSNSWKRCLPPYNPKESDLTGLQEPVARLLSCVKLLRTPLNCLRDWEGALRVEHQSAVPRCRNGAATSEGDMNLGITTGCRRAVTKKWR